MPDPSAATTTAPTAPRPRPTHRRHDAPTTTIRPPTDHDGTDDHDQATNDHDRTNDHDQATDDYDRPPTTTTRPPTTTSATTTTTGPPTTARQRTDNTTGDDDIAAVDADDVDPDYAHNSGDADYADDADDAWQTTTTAGQRLGQHDHDISAADRYAAADGGTDTVDPPPVEALAPGEVLSDPPPQVLAFVVVPGNQIVVLGALSPEQVRTLFRELAQRKLAHTGNSSG